ncbi:hypothetical protein Fcan01_28588, partial [Folsomia candida]
MSTANPYIIKNCLYHFVNVIGMSTFLSSSSNQHLIIISTLKYDLNVAFNHLATPESILENPDYIVLFLKANLNIIPVEFTNFFKDILALTVTSKFLIIDPTSTFYLNLLDATLFKVEDSETIIAIWNPHISYSEGNREVTVLKVPLSVPKLRTSYEYFGVIYNKTVVCHLGYKYSSSGRYCLIYTISTILNFTAFDYVFQPDEVPTIRPIAVVRKDGHQVLLEFLNNPADRMQVLSHFYTVLPFGFILIIDKTEFEIANPISTFDVFTWSLILSTIVLISCFLWIENGTGDSILHFNDLPLLTVASIVTEQSISIRSCTKGRTFPKVFKYLLLVWFVISIVLFGGFRSVFYRFLTSSVPPTNVPTTLEELMESKYTMVGSDSYLVSKGDGPTISVLKYILESYLYTSVDEEKYDAVGKGAQEMSKVSKREAQRKQKFTEGLKKLVFLDKMPYSKLRVLHNYSLSVPACCTNKPGIVLPKSFAMVSSTEGTRHFYNQMKSERDKYFLIMSKEFDYFLSTTELFAVTLNFFAEPFRRTQSILIESGLFQIWTQYGNDLMLKHDMQFASCLVHVYLNEGIKNKFWEYRTCLVGRQDDVTQLSQNLQDQFARPV